MHNHDSLLTLACMCGKVAYPVREDVRWRSGLHTGLEIWKPGFDPSPAHTMQGTSTVGKYILLTNVANSTQDVGKSMNRYNKTINFVLFYITFYGLYLLAGN